MPPHKGCLNMGSSTSATERSFVSTPWPPLVAVGFALSELGVLVGSIPVVLGGLILFGTSCAGIIRETGYVQTIWTPLKLIGVLFVLIGGVLWGSAVSPLTVDAAIRMLQSDRIALRGVSILLGGSLLTLLGFVGPVWTSRTAS